MTHSSHSAIGLALIPRPTLTDIYQVFSDTVSIRLKAAALLRVV